jgi:hypothetical protein
LYWEKLAWPTSNLVHFEGGPDSEFLEDCGILVRPRVQIVMSGQFADLLARAHVQGFLNLDKQEPGKWALAQGDTSFLIHEKISEPDRGLLIKLFKAIPVPNADVPLEDLIKFRQRRSSELLALRCAIDGLYQEVINSSDQELALRRCVTQIDHTCADILRISREFKFPIRFSNVKISTNLDLIKVISGYIVGQQYDMPLTGAVVGACLGTKVSFGFDCGITCLSTNLRPYRYVASFHHDVFCGY